MARAVPSTLHQKIKFVVEEQFISVATKEDIVQKISTRRLSKVTKMGVKQIIDRETRAGLGFGKFL